MDDDFAFGDKNGRDKVSTYVFVASFATKFQSVLRLNAQNSFVTMSPGEVAVQHWQCHGTATGTGPLWQRSQL